MNLQKLMSHGTSRANSYRARSFRREFAATWLLNDSIGSTLVAICIIETSTWALKSKLFKCLQGMACKISLKFPEIPPIFISETTRKGAAILVSWDGFERTAV